MFPSVKVWVLGQTLHQADAIVFLFYAINWYWL